MKTYAWSADARVRITTSNENACVRAAATLSCALLLLAAPLLAADGPSVRVTMPTRGDVHRFVAQPGTIRPLQQATLYAKVPGYLKSIAVDKGDAVKAGAVLAQIEVPELQAELLSQQAQIAKASADVARAQSEVTRRQAEVARFDAELNRLRAVLEKNEAERAFTDSELDRLTKARRQAPDLVTAQQLDKARSDREVLAATLNAARQTVAAAQAEQQAVRASVDVAQRLVAVAQAEAQVADAGLQRTRTLLSYTRITAPFGGMVTARFVDTGTFIPAATAGNSGQNAAIVTVMDFDTVRVQVAVTELEAALVVKGQPVKVALDGLPGKTFEGAVTRFSGALDENTRTMLVEAELPNPGHALRPGMYAMVRVGVEKHTNVMLVPSEALVMEKTSAFLFLADGGKAKKTPVKIGFNDGAKVEIVSGLGEAAKVILVGKMTLADGQAVNVQEGK
ncbi:MAG: efflux RND transporter periplasmic adaptor subunit [Verrucomicrobia bacterium]|nr:efflux RND transporter periplasmic adaptor subunit [Verrucomicrobiota bacterium]